MRYKVDLKDINDMDVAIIGISGKFPGSSNINEFWENLVAGHEMVTEFKEEELKELGVPSDTLQDSYYQPRGAILKDIDMFDAEFFNFTPFEAKVTDPQHRLFLECAWEALEDSGYVPSKFKGRIGVFGSTSMSSYLINNIMSNPEFTKEGINYPVLIGNDKDFLSTRVSYKLNLTGPSLTIQSACSSSLVNINYACQSILTGESDIALAGGVSVSVPHNVGYLYKEGGILSRDGHCRPFDKQASGTIKGNGCGLIVLKDLKQAIQDEDNIYGIIKGTSINNDGSDKIGYSAPSINGQSEAITEALYLSNLKGKDVGYIEAHGTGTPLGDPIEIQALSEAYGGNNPESKCAVGSLKANIGHLDSAAGIAGVIKTTLCLKEQMIVPTPNFDNVNEKLNLKNTPFYIPKHPEKKNLEYAGVSSFGIGGTNAHIILQKPFYDISGHSKEAFNLFVVSAKNKFSLEKNKENLIRYLKNNDPSQDDVAFTLAQGREEFEHRFVAMASTKDELIDKLQSSKLKSVSFKNKKLAFKLGFNHSLFKNLIENNTSFYDIFTNLMNEIEEIQSDLTIETLLNNEKFLCLRDYIYNYLMIKFLSESGITSESLITNNQVENMVILTLADQLELKNAIKYLLDLSPLSLKRDSIDPNFERLLSNEGYYIQIMNGLLKETSSIDSFDIKNKISNELDLLCLSTIRLENSTENLLDADCVYRNLLSLAGYLWSEGNLVNLKYFITKGKRISLPTYHFQKDKYWIESNKFLDTANAKQTEDNDITRIVMNAWCTYLEIEDIKLDDNFYDLGGDSLIAVEIVSDIREKLGADISMTEFIPRETPRELITFLEKKQHTSSLDFIKKIKDGNGDSCLVLIHPAGGNNLCYKNLFQYIDDCDDNVYLVSYPEKSFIDEEMRTVASYYIESLERVLNLHDCRLGGYSFGGNLAFEMALQLQKRRINIPNLIMFDTHTPEAYYGQSLNESFFVKAFPLVVEMFLKNPEIDFQKIEKYESNSLEVTINKIMENNNFKLNRNDYINFFGIWKHNHNALKTYYPDKKYMGDIFYFEAIEKESSEVMDLLKIKQIDKRTWSNHIDGEMKLFKVLGDHYSMFSNDDFVRHLAQSFKKNYLNKSNRVLI
ncbi:beta-ketoacyl synthase N-terminal-like domain-containing protein [Priestia megaterium]|uniref:type I polyketide synthase n=1 Tax=Priestia megaterium TaxID=1404 RepID=UPI0026E267E1|nr:beta-ketoacyl synthase N-terminal-like domain-containing protein [Priestia megaterium]MDO6851923.1 beta-ketoacyl synthase N-terminal-like domain-containing protein [Priestia megaterium]